MQSGKETLIALRRKLDECSEVEQLLAKAITDNPPIAIKEGDVIREGYNEKLDELRYASRNGKDWIAALEQKEREITGIKNLKIGYNRIFGYYIEITKSQLANVGFISLYKKTNVSKCRTLYYRGIKGKRSNYFKCGRTKLSARI